MGYRGFLVSAFLLAGWASCAGMAALSASASAVAGEVPCEAQFALVSLKEGSDFDKQAISAFDLWLGLKSIRGTYRTLPEGERSRLFAIFDQEQRKSSGTRSPRCGST